jgi:type 2 lantibiotic biosynthesis protein LanM
VPEAPDLPRHAERRLARWRAQSPFQDEVMLAVRLTADGLDIERFRGLLGESAPSLAKRAPAPDWLQAALRSFAAAAERPVPADLLPSDAPPEQSFLWLVAPLWRDAVERLAERLAALRREHPHAPFDAAALDLLLAPVRDRLVAMLGRTAVLELNVAREEDRLEGATPEDRFADFVAQIARPEVALSVLREYPVLLRQVVVWLDDAGAAAAELATRLTEDWPRLVAELFDGRDPGRLVEVRSTGDRHRGGRTVAVCRFASGERIVYKPKSLAVDRVFGELLAWLRERGGIDLRVPLTLDRGDYGWTEFVVESGCEDREALLRFYRRQGALLAMLHLLHATDFHNENLIAAGEYPVPIDLESLLRGSLAVTRQTIRMPPAVESIANSVLMIGLLPQRIWRGKDDRGTETSGLGGEEGQMSSRLVPFWEDRGTDRMRLVRRSVRLAAAQNRPRLAGEDVDPLQFSQTIESGFRDTYRLLASRSAELLAPRGPLARFADAEVRTILRHTQFYDLLLNESFHPDLLRNAVDRERLFDRLWYGIGGLDAAPTWRAVIPAEREDLWRGDIPFFSAGAGGRSARDARGREVGEVFSESGLDRCRRRLRGFGERDLERQLWYLGAAMSTLSSRSERLWDPPSLPAAPAPPEALLGEACRIGDRLEHLAVVRDDEAGWVGLALVRGEHWAPSPTNLDLYGGLPGIVLFLAYLAAATGERRYRELAERGFVGIRRQVAALAGNPWSPAAFQGRSGLVYLWLHLAALWHQDDLVPEALAMVPAIVAAEDMENDVLAGAAGVIPVLLHLYDATGDRDVLAAAGSIGERLVAAAEPLAAGLGWRTSVDRARPLGGFSHGASGCAWALAELAARLGDERLRAAADQGLVGERLAFHADKGNWRDLRGIDDDPPGSSPRFMVAWCHGAPGIGLARARMLRHGDDETLREELRVAVRTTANLGFGGGHSLCHGDFGNLELLREAEAILTPEELPRLSGRFAAGLLDNVMRRGWRCGVPMEVETPGLMVGLAGIGCGLLRAARPSLVPNVLMLDPPSTGAARR